MGSLHFAAALRQGARIGLGQRFVGEDMFGVGCGTAGTCISSGLWKNVTNRYLGFKFKIHGKAHYGWARLTVTVKWPISATLTGYAYETVPNKAIVTGKTKGPDADGPDAEQIEPTAEQGTRSGVPQPASLGMLALGATATGRKRSDIWQ